MIDSYIDFLRKVVAWGGDVRVNNLLLFLIWFWIIKIYYAIKEQTKFLKEDDIIDNIGEN